MKEFWHDGSHYLTHLLISLALSHTFLDSRDNKTDLFQDLNLDKKSSSSSSSRLALSAGASKMQSLVELKDVSLCCGSGSGGSGSGGGSSGQFSTGEYLYPLSSSTSPLHAVVSDFPQEQ